MLTTSTSTHHETWPLHARSVFTVQESHEITGMFMRANRCNEWKLLPFLDGEDEVWRSHATAIAAVAENTSDVPAKAHYTTCVLACDLWIVSVVIQEATPMADG